MGVWGPKVETRDGEKKGFHPRSVRIYQWGPYIKQVHRDGCIRTDTRLLYLYLTSISPRCTYSLPGRSSAQAQPCTYLLQTQPHHIACRGCDEINLGMDARIGCACLATSRPCQCVAQSPHPLPAGAGGHVNGRGAFPGWMDTAGAGTRAID